MASENRKISKVRPLWLRWMASLPEVDLLNSDLIMRPLRVFLVENHQDTAKYIRLYLEYLGHQVTTAGDMAAALEDFPKSECDVLICDIGLPDGDGWEVMERIKDRRPAFAIAMSGFGSESDLRRSRSAGYNHHLVKPFPPADLLALLREAGAVVDNQEKDRGRGSSGAEHLMEGNKRNGIQKFK